MPFPEHISRLLFVVVVVFAQFSCASSNEYVPQSANVQTAPDAVNINTADIRELDAIPNIGPKTAVKIVEHRERNGPFRRIEHLMLVDGISERRFREIRHLITVGTNP